MTQIQSTLENNAMSIRLEAMRSNPRGGWTIADVIALCREFDVFCKPPRGGGSHCKIAHQNLPEKLTVPYKKPIKPVYVRKLVAFIDVVRKLP